MKLVDWHGHDSLIDEVLIDITRRTVTVRGSSYPHDDAPDRVPLTILFTEVDSVTTAADMVALAHNAFAGHVNHAHLTDRKGASYVYLVEGYVAVTARKAPRLTLGE